ADALTAALLPLGAPVTRPPYTPRAERRLAAITEEPRGERELAVAVASGRGIRPLDLIPPALRRRRLTRSQWITVGVLAASLVLSIAALLVPGYREHRRLETLSGEIGRIDSGVRSVERIVAELERKRQLLAAVQNIEASAVRPLPLLRELTEILPGDAWLTMLSLDAKGVELTGQAAQASVLIPLLENSPLLERVEFASPVTRGRDREQFRIRAAWEARRPAATPAAVAPAGPRAPDAPAATRAKRDEADEELPALGGTPTPPRPAPAHHRAFPQESAVHDGQPLAARTDGHRGGASRRDSARRLVVRGRADPRVEPPRRRAGARARADAGKEARPDRAQGRDRSRAPELDRAAQRRLRAVPHVGDARGRRVGATEARQGDGRPGQYRGPQRAHPAAGRARRAARNPRGDRRVWRGPAARRSPRAARRRPQAADRPGLPPARGQREPAEGATRHAHAVGIHPSRHPPGQDQDLVSKRLLVLNVLLVGVGLFCLAFIVQQLDWTPPPPTARPRPATPSNSPLAGAP